MKKKDIVNKATLGYYISVSINDYEIDELTYKSIQAIKEPKGSN